MVIGNYIQLYTKLKNLINLEGDTTNPTLLPNYLHFGNGLGFDRLCAGTVTVLGSGLPTIRVGRHLTLVAIISSPF